jgi:Prealbumin-like fold domain
MITIALLTLAMPILLVPSKTMKIRLFPKTLRNANGVVATTTSGLYQFTDLEPGEYTLTEKNPPGLSSDGQQLV